MKNLNLKLISVIIFIILLVAIIACANNDKAEVKEKEIPVNIEPVLKEKLSIPIHTSGKIASTSESKLSFKTGGIISSILANEGQSIKKGALIAQLNMSEINSQVKQAKEGFEKAKRDYRRIEKLYADSVVTLEQLQNVQTAMDVAQSSLEIAKFNQEYSKIYAPSNGKILRKFAENNELVSPGVPIVLFGSTDAGWVMKVGLTDKDLIKLNLGDKAEVKFDAHPNQIFEAAVTEIGGAANPMTGTFQTELTIQSKNLKLSSGFIAKADIFPSTTKSFFTIPIESIYEADGHDAIIFSVDKNSSTAKRINIKLKKILPNKVAVESGLESTQHVITSGVEYLSSGTKIRVIK